MSDNEFSRNLNNNSGVILPVNINEEMRGSYLDYAMSVIVARALPDARDGLKPVHRRILYAMYDMGIRPGTPYKKSARIVGEVLGKYHPHGDSAVYDAMARMVQDFSLRYPLIDGQGNFGSVDGDSPAAMRYTEARLATITEEMLADIDMNTVNFQENYDGTQQEPTVLPARLPNMLINGSTGIAVGMATSIPPHNLREIAEAVIYLIDNYERINEVTVDDLMEFIKGPDFPTGAEIITTDELKEAYATGKGRIAVRGSHSFEETRDGLVRIIFHSIPYQISKSSIVERIALLVRDGRLDEIRDLRDESDRHGMRLVIELKRTAVPRIVLNKLYKYTQLQSTHSINILALVNGEPRLLSLKRSLQIYIDHRYEVIFRRSEFELAKQRARMHILLGLLKALDNLDAIIQTIRGANDVESARAQLISRFDLSETQANAILDMQLRRLAALERQKLQDEYAQVNQRITYLDDLLRSPDKIRGLIREDIVEISQKYGNNRKTAIVFGESALVEEDLVQEEQIILSLTINGYIKRVPASAYRVQRRGGKGVTGMQTREQDALWDIVPANTVDTLLFFTDRGRVYSEKAYRIPESGRADRGTLAQTFLSMDDNERITAVLPVPSFEMENQYLVMVTHEGKIKRADLQAFADVRSSGRIAISLGEGDYLAWVKATNGTQDVIIVSEGGRCLRFHETDVRVVGRTAGGINAIRLRDGDSVAGMDTIGQEHTHLLVVTSAGFGKRSALDLYSSASRFGKGVRTLSRHDGLGAIVAVRCVSQDNDLMLMTSSGLVLRMSMVGIRESGRTTKGVTVIDVADGDSVVAVAVFRQRADGSEASDAPEVSEASVIEDVEL